MLQTPAERHLVAELTRFLRSLAGRPAGEPALVLNVGAGLSLSIERQLAALECRFVCDRVDIGACAIDDAPSFVGTARQSPVERMDGVPSARYDVVFANYLLEHVRDVAAAAAEIRRVLRPGGLFAATVPNPRAPQFVLARVTPTAFHRWVRGAHAHDTVYAYGSIGDLVGLFERAGLAAAGVARFSFVEGYAERAPALRGAGRVYDRVIAALGLRALMGDAALLFRRPSDGP